MTEFRNKLINDVIKTNEKRDRRTTFIATVTKENGQHPTIKFINADGVEEETDNTETRTYGNDDIPYEPLEGDEVVAEYENNIYTIIARQNKNEGAAKDDMKTASDQFSNLIYDKIPGLIVT